MKYGYARVSTTKQSIERQIRNIREYAGDALMVTDETTGTNMNRPGWQKIMKACKPGDTIVFDSVSRMSRNADEGFEIYQKLFEKGIDLVFIKEPHISTETYKAALTGQINMHLATGDEKTDSLVNSIAAAINSYLLALAKEQIRLAFEQAEKEVQDLHQRTKEGIETARLNGKTIGRTTGDKLTTKKSIACKEIIMKHSKDFNGTLNDAEMLALTGLSRNTYYKYKRELKAC